MVPCLAQGVDAPLDLQASEIHETPTTTFVESPVDTAGVNSVPTPALEELYDDDMSLKHFFRRPVRVAAGNWNVDGVLDTRFNPWANWANNARISNRLNNFRHFTGELHVKIVISGNPMSWGAAMMSYWPNPNPSFAVTSEPQHLTDYTFYGDLMKASQRPHVMINPTTSTGGELTIPLHSLTEVADLTTNAFANWGQLWLVSLAPLRQLSSTKALNWTIYAWCENVMLSGPTQVNMSGLSAQAGAEQEKGSLSQTLGVIAKAAGAARSVPVVGKWMTAAQMAAKLGADVAFAFGFSKPLSQHPTQRTVEAAPDICTHDGLDVGYHLGTSPNQQMPVDLESVGFGGEDMMEFKNIAKIPSLIYTASWDAAVTKNSLLFSMPVSPLLNWRGTRPLTNAVATQLTPMGLVAANFKYWRGSLRVRLQIAANVFHRGRLLIVWDAALTPTLTEEHVVKSMIVDISETRDFQFDIGWCSQGAVALTCKDDAGLKIDYQVKTTPINATLYNNGVLSVYVLNELVSNVTSTTAINVHAWVSMPDIEVFEPTGQMIESFSLYPTAPTVALALEPVSEEEPLELQSGGVEDEDVFKPDVVPALVPKRERTVVGQVTSDVTCSFRKLLKRYAFVRCLNYSQVAAAGDFVQIRVHNAVTPVAYGPGYTISGWDGTLTNTRKTIPLTPIAFVTQSYTFWRGSVRAGFSGMNTGALNTFTVARGWYRLFPFFNSTSTNNPNLLFRTTDYTPNGAVVDSSMQQRMLQVEVPHASWRKFHPTTMTTTATTDFENHVLVCDFEQFGASAGTRNMNYKLHLAAGEDFNLLWFRGVTTLYDFDPPS